MSTKLINKLKIYVLYIFVSKTTKNFLQQAYLCLCVCHVWTLSLLSAFLGYCAISLCHNGTSRPNYIFKCIIRCRFNCWFAHTHNTLLGGKHKSCLTVGWTSLQEPEELLKWFVLRLTATRTLQDGLTKSWSCTARIYTAGLKGQFRSFEVFCKKFTNK